MEFLTAYGKSLGFFLMDLGIALVPFVVLLVVYKLIIQGRYRLSGQDLDRELSSPTNNAVNILLVGLLFGLMFAFKGLALPRDASVEDRALHVVVFGGLAIALQFVAQIVANKLILHGVDDVEHVFKHGNNSMACVKAGIAIATGLIVATTGTGSLRLIGQSLVWFVVGQSTLVLIAMFYQWITPYDVQAELEKKNLSVGLGFAGLLVAGGLVVSRAVVGGETHQWGAELLSVITYIVSLLAVALLMRRLVNWFLLPKVEMDSEIAEHRNIGVGLVEAAGYILPTMYFVGVL